jgi:arylsulfatase A-like enzyme
MERSLPIRIKQDNPVYAGLIEQTDEAVGQVLNTLEKLNLDDNTIVVFVSDNGGVAAGDNFSTSNRPLRGGKGYQWEAGIRVPFFIKAPQLEGLGKKIDTAVSGMDLFPTLLELAGIESTLVDIDGKSLVPLLKNEPFMDRPLFWHYPHYGNQGGDPSSIIREGKWKLIKYWETGFYEMYDLNKDIGEKDDIILDNPRIATDLIKKLDLWLKATQAKIPVVDPLHDPEKEKEWLEENKLKLKEKLEEKRSFMLNKEYVPNKDWWGTAVID